MNLTPGTRLGPYEIVAPLGAGGMGDVYRARDTRLGREVAIKILSPDRALTDDRRQRFLQEARAVSSLNHPHIVTLHDIGQHEGQDYLVMEYVAGRTLDQVIGHRGLPAGEALRFAIPLADALAQAHAAGILHRDIKPSNVMVTEEGVVKVLDFGLAKLVAPGGSGDDLTATAPGVVTREGTVAGTPAYMSPEQVEGKALDARSDVFSVGAVLYELVTGVRAFGGESAASVMAAVLREEPQAPTQVARAVPAELEQLILRCLRKDPARRVQSMADVRAQLEEIRDGVASASSSAAASGVIRAAQAGPRRRPIRWMLATGTGLAAIGALAWLTWGRAGDRAPGAVAGRQVTPLEAVPLTSFVGDESQPTLSPDGSQVAYSANIEDESNIDIYVQVVGLSTRPLRLTSDPGRDTWPTWSPDGRWIVSRVAAAWSTSTSSFTTTSGVPRATESSDTRAQARARNGALSSRPTARVSRSSPIGQVGWKSGSPTRAAGREYRSRLLASTDGQGWGGLPTDDTWCSIGRKTAGTGPSTQ